MSDTQQIKDNLDIVDLIGEYVQLKPAGSNHKGLCPFHNEKSPSFMVSRERQSWRCFGCNKGGDIFSFVQEIEGMEFVEALKLLADKAGVTLTNNFSGNKQAGEKKVRLKQIMEGAVHFYHQFLLKMDAAAEARDYLKQRGLDQHTIDVWKIGFVPDQWDLLTKYLLQKGFSIDDLVDAGLTIKRDNADRRSGKGYYDRFRGRIMFPICDAQGNPVGVTGRVLVETDTSGGKYVNTPQTDIFDKSKLLFGLDKAKAAIRQKDQVVVVEGQMDTIAVWQSGMEQVVASSGTALTEEQVKLMKRYTKNIAMAFDTDAAGLKAAKRGIAIALEQGMRVHVIQIPEDIAKDPDECIKKNPEIWNASVRDAKSVLAWYIDLAVRQHDLNSPQGKQKAADDVLPEILRIPYAVEQDHWMRELAAAIGVDVSVLKDDTERLRPKQSKRIVSDVGKSETGRQHASPKTPFDQLVEEYVSLLLAFPPIAAVGGIPLVHNQISEPTLQLLYKQLETLYTAQQSITLEQIETPDSKLYIDSLLLTGLHHYEEFTEAERNDAAGTLVSRITDASARTTKQHLITELAAAEAAGDNERVQKILTKLQ